jgi:alkylhydroperoxidase family enzyme
MSRIAPIPADQWPVELSAFRPETMSDVEQDVMGIQAHLPATMRAYFDMKATLAREGALGARLFELIRLRVAYFNQCRSCMAVRYTEDVGEALVCSLERPAEADDLTAAEKSALRFAEMLATDHLSIDDAVYADLRLHFSESEIIAVGLAAAFAVGVGRLASTWQVTDHLEEKYTQAGIVAPWADASV